MKKSISILMLTAMFVLSFVFTVSAGGGTYIKFCSQSVGLYANCDNYISNATDDLTNFDHLLSDNFKPTDSYHIYFYRTVWDPTVNRGAPVYKNYLIVDNKNSITYTYSRYNGTYLNDFGSLYQYPQQTTDYYPASGEKPTTNLYIKSGDGADCASKPWACNSYVHASEFSVK